MSYKIGSFNMHNIGLTALGNKNERNLKLIADIIRKEKFDVVAFQEVLSEGKVFISPDYAKKSIMMELGPDWDFKWANADSSVKDSRNEGYAFAWNKKRLRLATYIDNGKERVFNPVICRVSQDDMIKKPFYARFTPSGTLEGGPWVEFRLLCVHTYFGNDDKSDRKIRKKEIDTLIQEVYPQISDRKYGKYGKGMTSYTILLGDYNMGLYRAFKEEQRIVENEKRRAEGKSYIQAPAYLETDENDIIETVKWGHKRIKTVQYEYTTLKTKEDDESDNSETRGYSHDYDHFSYDVDRFEGVGVKARRIDAVRKYCNKDFEKYRKSVSDHIPVILDIDLKNEEK